MLLKKDERYVIMIRKGVKEVAEEKLRSLERCAKRIIKYSLRYIISYFCIAIISVITGGLFSYVGLKLAQKELFSTSIVYIIASTTVAFAMYSVTRAFELYDTEAQSDFVGIGIRKYRLFSGASLLFKRRLQREKMLCCLFTYLALFSILPVGFGYGSLLRALVPSGTDNIIFEKLIVGTVVVPLIILSTFLAKTSAHKWWVIAGEAERERILGTSHPKVRLSFEILKIFFIYSLGFYIMPGAIMLFVSLCLTVALFNDPKIWIALVVIIALIVSFRYIRAYFSRCCFMKKVFASLAREGYTVLKKRHICISAIKPIGGVNLVFEKNGKSYALKLISSVHRRCPAYISAEGIVTSKRTVSFLKFDFFHIMTDTLYAFGAQEGESKIVVFSPMPRTLYFNYGRTDIAPSDGSGGFNAYSAVAYTRAVGLSGGASNAIEGHASGRRYRGPGYVSDIDRGIIKRFQTGETLGEYKFFTPEGLISAIDNDCLDR